jgi:hypothetical protein
MILDTGRAEEDTVLIPVALEASVPIMPAGTSAVEIALASLSGRPR